MNKKDRELRNQHIVNQYNLGASKEDLALLNNMTVQNINVILRNNNKKKVTGLKSTITIIDEFVSSDNLEDPVIKDFVTYMDKLSTIPKDLKHKNPRNITFKNKMDAEIILEKMVEFIVLRGKASLARFYLINGMRCHKHDHFNGWTDASYFIKNTKVVYFGPDVGYRINLAPSKEIEYDMVNDLFPKDYKVKIYES